MNFLNKPGIQTGENNFVEKIEQKIHETGEFKPKIELHSKSKFYYLVISCLVLFIVFASYVFYANNSTVFNDKIIISNIINEFSNKKNMVIKSLKSNNNTVNTILLFETEGSLFENIYDIKVNNPNVRMKINSNLHEAWMKKYVKTNKIHNIDKIIDIINNNDSRVEKEIVGDDLVIIGTIKEIQYLFLLLENNNFNNIEFKLNQIEYGFNKTFYKLII